jgi:hypothetical protein
MTTTTKRIAHRIYEFTHNGHTFQVDGQNHEFDSKEWQLMIFQDGNYEWVDTYPTKRDAIDDAITRF